VAFADSGINLRLNVWINDPQEGTLGIKSAINLAVWRRFGAEGIQIPFPQREVRILAGDGGGGAHPSVPAPGAAPSSPT
jgi:small-conductance mechanosensitive channel